MKLWGIRVTNLEDQQASANNEIAVIGQRFLVRCGDDVIAVNSKHDVMTRILIEYKLRLREGPVATEDERT